MKIVAKTDKGRIRESNQDAYSVGEFPTMAYAVVCDGMGGAAGGNIASALAVKVISDKINASYHTKMKDSSIKNMLQSALVAANVEVFDMASQKSDLQGMGTTVVCAVVKDSQAFIAHAGDSRAYILSEDGKLRQVTTDHSMVQDLVNNGKITPDEAKNHPNKNIITRAIGVDKDIQIDFDQVNLLDNEVLILCTDGLSNYVSDNEMIDEINDGKYYAYADRLVQKANNNGGGDNITVVAIAN